MCKLELKMRIRSEEDCQDGRPVGQQLSVVSSRFNTVRNTSGRASNALSDIAFSSWTDKKKEEDRMAEVHRLEDNARGIKQQH